MKWVKFMQIYTFVLKHKSRKTNMLADTLSQRVTLLGMTIVQSTGLESMKVDYEVDKDFVNAWKASKEPWSNNITPYLD